jgi:acetyltransferase
MRNLLDAGCVGLIVPKIGLNASSAHTSALPGKLVLISQLGAMVTALRDWAKSRDIGFSHFVSLGNGADVDFGDTVDYLGSDRDTRAILLYIESITEARKFMSAARVAARNKPVLAVKVGRAPSRPQATGWPS